MNRKIELEIRRNEENNDEILVVLTDVSKDNVLKIMKEYDLKDYANEKETNLYNQMINDFNVEYDNEIADMIDLLLEQIGVL